MTAVLRDGRKPQSLGTLIPGGTCRPLAINNRGQVVGMASTEGIYKDHAFLWDGSTLHDLGTAGGRTSAANAINNKGQIVGTGFHSNDLGKSRSGGTRAFVLTPR